jgi:hypothetical protein
MISQGPLRTFRIGAETMGPSKEGPMRTLAVVLAFLMVAAVFSNCTPEAAPGSVSGPVVSLPVAVPAGVEILLLVR